MAKIGFTCPHCGHKVQVPAAVLGKQGKCAKCRKLVTIVNSSAQLKDHKSPTPASQSEIQGGSHVTQLDTTKFRVTGCSKEGVFETVKLAIGKHHTLDGAFLESGVLRVYGMTQTAFKITIEQGPNGVTVDLDDDGTVFITPLGGASGASSTVLNAKATEFQLLIFNVLESLGANEVLNRSPDNSVLGDLLVTRKKQFVMASGPVLVLLDGDEVGVCNRKKLNSSFKVPVGDHLLTVIGKELEVPKMFNWFDREAKTTGLASMKISISEKKKSSYQCFYTGNPIFGSAELHLEPC